MAVSRKARLGIFALVGLGLGAVLVLWSYREPIAKQALDDYFARHGVEASYQIKAIETRRQRFEQVRLGPASAPDLTADWVEVDVGPSLSGLSAKAVRAGGVRLRGRYIGKSLSLGSLDRLLPAPTGAPFELPRLDLSLEDARARIDTPWGGIGLRLDGQGNLRSGFEGKLAAVAPRFAAQGCAVRDAQLYGDLSVVGARPSFAGPLRFDAITCPAVQARRGTVRLDASMAENGGDWRGTAHADLADVGDHRWQARDIAADLAFKARGPKTSTRFTTNIGGLKQGDQNVAAGLKLAGEALLGQRGIMVTGRAEAQSLAGRQTLGPLQAQLDGYRGAAVIGPVAAQLHQALGGLSDGFSGRGQFSLSHVDGKTSLQLADLRFASPTGARFLWAGDQALGWDEDGWSLHGRAEFGGGGLPAGRAEFAGRSGVIRVAPYRARGGLVTLDPIAVNLADAGLGVRTRVTLDGPVPGGRVRGLSFPLTLAPGAVLPSGCFGTRLQSLAAGALHIGQSAVRTCLSGQELRLIAPRLAGRLGSDPIRLAAQSVAVSLGAGRLRAQGGAVQIEGTRAGTMLSFYALSGSAKKGGWQGDISGMSGALGGVPIRATSGAGQWRFAHGVLQLDGRADLDDPSADPAFFRVRAEQVRLAMRQGQLTGTAELQSERTGAPLAHVQLRHDLAAGQGNAQLKVDGLVLGDALQPEEVTPVTLGVVANVRGALRGEGEIIWGPDGVRSHGRFASDGLDFAAAFGPVTAMAGEVRFSDLLHLVTEPDQKMRIGAINPGVVVGDGDIRYRILPGYKVEVLAGRWPFAGGALILEPTIIDMSHAAVRRLTFRVEGLDAARFIAAMGFENIAATGVYDGVLPMVFDDRGGRIEGGRLVARGGGTLSYVGPVSNENLGMMGRFAFDALKSMRYNRLAIDLDGAIDGDVITRISFAGVNQAPVAGGRSKLPIKVLGVSNLPFIFNVTITAKFRQLFDMAKSFNDPSVLINRMVPQLEPLPSPPPAVQPADSQPQP
ncbi:MAG: YdbH domain-containing protein [Chakrabartia sp.]